MDASVLERKPKQAVIPQPPTGKELLEAVALALEARGSEITTGYDGIEHRNPGGILKEASKGTVFGWIAEELSALGVAGDMSTVGGTLKALGIVGDGVTSNDENEQYHAAHVVGCNCHGPEITAAMAAQRVRIL